MNHLDLFEATNGYLYLVPDTENIVYIHALEDLTGAFACEAYRLLHDEESYCQQWDYQEKRSEIMETLTQPDTLHIADYTRVMETAESCEDRLHFYSTPGERGILYLGPILSYLALRKPLPAGPRCHRCLGTTHLIGVYDVEPWGNHEIQHTIMYQCPACGQYRQTGFEDGADWIGDRFDGRSFVRLLPDPYVRTGRLRLSYHAHGRQLNLDGKALRLYQAFELLVEGVSHRGHAEMRADGRFFFVFDGRSRPDLDLLPGMQARLLD